MLSLHSHSVHMSTLFTYLMDMHKGLRQKHKTCKHTSDIKEKLVKQGINQQRWEKNTGKYRETHSFASASWVGDWMNHLFYLPNVSSFCLSNVNVESDEPADLTDWIFTVSCFFSQINLVSVYSIKDFVHSVQLFFPSGRKSGCQMIFVAASKMLN